jgi:predicted transcriptional regulator
MTVVFLLLLCLLMTGAASPAFADSSYSVRPHVDGSTDILTDNSGADAETSVWDAPLSVLVQFVAAVVATSVGSYCLMFVIGRIQDVLSHEKRKIIYDFICSNPGCTITDISEKLSINIGTVYHHLWMLNARRKVFLESHGKFVRVYEGRLRASDKKIDRAVCAHLRNDISKRLLQAILDKPGLNNASLAQAVSLDKSTICWHLQRLSKDGLIDMFRDGRQKRCFINDHAGAILKEYDVDQAESRPSLT